jgi:hypothetical protein
MRQRSAAAGPTFTGVARIALVVNDMEKAAAQVWWPHPS